jgi:hypothetical protein
MEHGIKCPFCGHKLTLHTYKSPKDKRFGIDIPRVAKAIVFCDNDDCAVMPCTNDTSPSVATAEAKQFGVIGL